MHRAGGIEIPMDHWSRTACRIFLLARCGDLWTTRQPRSFHQGRSAVRIALLRLRLGWSGGATGNGGALHPGKECEAWSSGGNHLDGAKPLMSEPVLTATPVNCCPAAANKAPATPSLTLGGLFPRPRRGAGLTRLVGTHTDHTDANVASSGGLLLRSLQFAAICLIVILVGCGNEPSAKKSETAPPPKPA